MAGERYIMYEISIIVPIYNAHKYLERCVESLRSQTYKKIEIILVNDGSTDGSEEICNNFVQNNDNIRIFSQVNQGASAAREKGVQLATGQYVMFVDADDWLDANAVKILKIEADKAEADIVCGQLAILRATQKSNTKMLFEEPCITCDTVGRSMYQFFITRFINGSLGGKLFKRELFNEFVFYKDISIGEDISMVISLLKKAKRVSIINKRLYYYFWNRSSISHSGYTNRHKKGFYNYILLRDEVVHNFPQISVAVIGYFAEFEMSVVTAMCRNNKYDKKVIKSLKMDLKKNMISIIQNTYTSFYLKVSAVLIAYALPSFCCIFKMIYKISGR